VSGKIRINLKNLFRRFGMRSLATPSIDQLLVLLAVVETGSFTAAAKRLGRATSAITYAIDTLEKQLGLSLFDRGTTRKPKLTQQGEAIVSEARAVAESIETFRARVKGLRAELEPEVSLVVDSLFPNDRLVALLRDFHAAFPTVPVRLFVQALGGVERAVRSGVASIGVGNSLHMNMTGFQRIDIPGVQVIPVAAPSHPLASANEAAQLRARDFIHLVLSEHPEGDGRDFAVIGLTNWRFSRKAPVPPRWARMGRNAGTDGSRRHRSWKARAVESSRLAGRRIRHAGGVQDRHAAGSCGPMAD
jgi:DNA-binding transcriptional LysR family regulator